MGIGNERADRCRHLADYLRPAARRSTGSYLFIEMAPGHICTYLVAKLFPNVRVVSITDQGLRYATVLAGRESPSTV